MIVLLDTGPLGMLTNPRDEDNQEIQDWLRLILFKDYRVILPEISDYELRRELLRANKSAGVERLDQFKQRFEYLPLTTDVMLQAAELWAKARQTGKPTADPHALDGDVILAAQAMSIETADQTVIATTNVRHLSLFVDAREWSDIE
jgi:predicted nucleic acid-binding protein